jgi:hypothetical protein
MGKYFGKNHDEVESNGGPETGEPNIDATEVVAAPDGPLTDDEAFSALASAIAA